MTQRPQPVPGLPLYPEPTRFTKRNYWIFVGEGAFYGSAMSFVALDTIIPSFVREAGGSDTLIAFLPTLLLLGFSLPQLFTAHLIEKLDRFLPLLAFTGFLQRLPYLIVALVLWNLPEDKGAWALWIVVLCPLLSGLLGGFTIGAWMRMTARVVPGRRRSSGTALRSFVASSAGIVAGVVAERILSNQPSIQGMAQLHLIAFCVLMVSYCFFVFTDEPKRMDAEGADSISPKPPVSKAKVSRAEAVAALWSTLSDNRQFRFFIASRVGEAMCYVLVPFMSIHAIVTTGHGVEFAGRLLAFQMAGGICGNILGGYLGDRSGGRSVLILARFAFMTAALLVLFGVSDWMFCIAFLFWGANASLQAIGDQTFLVEFGFGKKLASFTAVASFVGVLSMLSAGTIAATLRGLSEGVWLLGVVALSGVALSAYLLIRHVTEPRNTNEALQPRLLSAEGES